MICFIYLKWRSCRRGLTICPYIHFREEEEAEFRRSGDLPPHIRDEAAKKGVAVAADPPAAKRARQSAPAGGGRPPIGGGPAAAAAGGRAAIGRGTSGSGGADIDPSTKRARRGSDPSPISNARVRRKSDDGGGGTPIGRDDDVCPPIAPIGRDDDVRPPISDENGGARRSFQDAYDPAKANGGAAQRGGGDAQRGGGSDAKTNGDDAPAVPAGGAAAEKNEPGGAVFGDGRVADDGGDGRDADRGSDGRDADRGSDGRDADRGSDDGLDADGGGRDADRGSDGRAQDSGDVDDLQELDEGTLLRTIDGLMRESSKSGTLAEVVKKLGTASDAGAQILRCAESLQAQFGRTDIHKLMRVQVIQLRLQVDQGKLERDAASSSAAAETDGAQP